MKIKDFTTGVQHIGIPTNDINKTIMLLNMKCGFVCCRKRLLVSTIFSFSFLMRMEQ